MCGRSDVRRVRTELRHDGGDLVGGEAAATRVLEDCIPVSGVVDAVDPVAGHVADDPDVRDAERLDGRVRRTGDLGELVLGEVLRVRDLPLDDETLHCYSSGWFRGLVPPVPP